jgi:hypothetical protein
MLINHKWGHNIAYAKTNTKIEAEDKIEEIEAGDPDYLVSASPLKTEREWYQRNYR